MKRIKNNFEKIKSKYVELIYNQKFITVGSIINSLIYLFQMKQVWHIYPLH